METVMEQFVAPIVRYIPQLMGALAILIIGTVIAFVIAGVVRSLLHRTTLDDRLAALLLGEHRAQKIPVEEWTARGLFALLMVVVLVGFFQQLGLNGISEPLQNMLTRVLEYGPRIIGAAVLLFVAWVVASLLRLGVIRGLAALKLDERVNERMGAPADRRIELARPLGEAVYWLTFALFLPAVLDALALHGPLQPITEMFNRMLGYIPHIVGAALILFVGWVIARTVQRIVTNLLAAAGLDAAGQRFGLGQVLGQQTLSRLAGLVVYVLILVPVMVAALHALQLEAITRPASQMLEKILAAIPHLLAAALLLIVAYLVARVVANLVTGLLEGVGFNSLPAKLGLGQAPTDTQRAPATVAGKVVLVAVMLFATIEAARLLTFDALAALLTDFLRFGGHIILGLVILGIGLYLARLAVDAIRASGPPHASLLAVAARIAIIVLASAMGLRQMQLASDIINLAFGLTLGAVAVAVAIAFGLGGRDLAARTLEQWRQAWKSEEGGTGRTP